MRKSAKIITALSVTGLAVVAGSAFTGAGLSTSGQASYDQFIGGTVAQEVEGAVLTDLSYRFVEDETGSQTSVDQVTLTFAEGADEKEVDLALTATTGTAFICSDVAVLSNQSICTGTATGVSKASVTVETITDQSPTP